MALSWGLLTVGRASAQRGLPGQIGIQVTAGTVDGLLIRNAHKQYSYFGSLAMTRCGQRGRNWLFGLSYLQKDYLYGIQVVPKAQFAGEVGYFMPLLSDRGRNVALKLGVSGLAGYETSN